jgi:hypothetical protein
MNFSQRIGLEPTVKPFQKHSMDKDLRNGLWNAFWMHAFQHQYRNRRSIGTDRFYALARRLWIEHFKRPVDELPSNSEGVIAVIRPWFLEYLNTPWNRVYDFLDFTAQALDDPAVAELFTRECNATMEKEFSAYRFVAGHIMLITDEAEIASINQAASVDSGPLGTVSVHIKHAAKLLSDREKPDYRNSMKEAISAVEGLCKIVARMPKATLGPALDAIKGKVQLHPKMEEGLKAIYAYTSDYHGIRHALKDDREPDAEDARFMLVTCSAFVNYLAEKASKHGLL